MGVLQASRTGSSPTLIGAYKRSFVIKSPEAKGEYHNHIVERETEMMSGGATFTGKGYKPVGNGS
jgi:hypothetical protein